MSLSLEQVGHSLRLARKSVDAAITRAELAAQAAAEDGIAETEIARRLGVNRLTVRRWLGK